MAREILFRAADRTGVQVTLVANQALRKPSSPNISTLQVGQGFDVADDEIVKRLNAGDLVITSDIPLAAEVIEKGAHALNPRGEMLTTENIRAKLNMRDFLDTMRASGVDTSGGPAAYGQRDKQTFANSLDRFLTKHSQTEERLAAVLERGTAFTKQSANKKGQDQPVSPFPASTPREREAGPRCVHREPRIDN